MARKLFSLNAAEISLVPNGANGKRFLILKKGQDKTAIPADILEALKKDPKEWEKVKKAIDGMKKASPDGAAPAPAQPGAEGQGLSARAEAAVKAVIRILAPFKDELSPLALHEVLDSAGWQLHETQEHGDNNPGAPTEGNTMDNEDVEMSVSKGEQVPMEHHMKAMEEAKKAYSAHLQKLGKPEHPSPPAHADNHQQGPQGNEPEKEIEKSMVTKSGDLDLSKVDPNLRPVLELIYKSNRDLVKTNADLRLQLEDVKKAGVEKELVQKVSAFTHYEGDKKDLVKTLARLQATDKESFDIVMKQLESAERVKKASAGGLFQEIGSSLQDGTTELTGYGQGSGVEASAWDKIEKMAEGIVQKSSSPMTKEMALDKVLKSKEGQELYRVYKGSRKGGA